MNVLLVGNHPSQLQHSMLGFAEALRFGLCARGIKARLLAPTPRVSTGPIEHHGLNKWLGHMDRMVLFPAELRRALDWADVTHICDQGNAPFVRHVRSKPTVITCHDLLAVRAARGEFPDWKTGPAGRALQRMIVRGLEESSSVACDSMATYQDLLRITRLPATRSEVIYQGLHRDFARMKPMESAAALDDGDIVPAVPEPFILHIGGNQPYKNRMGVLKIFAALRREPGFELMHLVMAGKPFPESLRRFVAEAGMQGYVREVARPRHEQVHALYSRAEALLFPSLNEGFGLPIIEAQACGCPVFVSDRAPMTEVGGDATVRFDPEQTEQAAGLIAQHWDRREDMRVAGLNNADRFTTTRMLDGYVALYQRLLQT